VANSSRKLRRLNQARAVHVLPELTGKMSQVLEVGQHLAQVSAQIEEVNGKLADLDNLLLNLNHLQMIVTQSLEEGLTTHEEQARQRFVSLKMYELLLPHPTPEAVSATEEGFRAEFNASLQKSVEVPEIENGD
jgi:hypothetical protein